MVAVVVGSNTGNNSCQNSIGSIWVQQYLFLRIQRRFVRFPNPICMLKTMVSRPSFGRVWCHQGPERAFWVFYVNLNGLSSISIVGGHS